MKMYIHVYASTIIMFVWKIYTHSQNNKFLVSLNLNMLLKKLKLQGYKRYDEFRL